MALLTDIILQHGEGIRGVQSFFSDRDLSTRLLKYWVDTINSITTNEEYVLFMQPRVSCMCLGVQPTVTRNCSTCEISSLDLAIKSCGTAEMMRCGRCREERYCSVGCQRDHWRNGHKEECSTSV
jgi:hypothetical protein